MKILLIDNYDSFTYNLVHYIEQVSDTRVTVVKNDLISIDSIDEFDKIIVSPGPGLPAQAGILLEAVRRYAHSKSILGVCLGHQAIAEAFGGSLVNLKQVLHGVASEIEILGENYLFHGINKMLKVGRYHSWIVNKADLPSCFEITAIDNQGQIMAMGHKSLDIQSVQFHPESILTEHGLKMIENWVNHV